MVLKTIKFDDIYFKFLFGDYNCDIRNNLQIAPYQLPFHLTHSKQVKWNVRSYLLVCTCYLLIEVEKNFIFTIINHILKHQSTCDCYSLC